MKMSLKQFSTRFHMRKDECDGFLLVDDLYPAFNAVTFFKNGNVSGY
jgi:hypothetical protein